MSLFGDILNSIGSGQSPAPPQPSARPLSATVQRPTLDVSKSSSRLGVPAAPLSSNGTKRKAEDGSPMQPEKLVKTSSAPTLNNRITHRPAAPPLNAPKLANGKAASGPRPKIDSVPSVPSRPGSAPITSATLAPNGPPKGSYAELMARAKQAQTDKGQQNQVGLIIHQTTSREKTSKVAERRRQEEGKAKSAKEKPNNTRLAPGGKQQVKSRSVSPAKKTDLPKAPKAARPPLHAPPSSSYKGTMGLSGRRTTKQPPKRERQNEYLDTDEEDVSDDMDGYGEDEPDGYGSDASSDMEAGLDDMYAEDQRALKVAKEEDAREQALETQLKREKESRKQKLQSLANKSKSKK